MGDEHAHELHGQHLAPNSVVYRFAREAFPGEGELRLSELAFTPTEADKASPLQGLSVWEERLTPPATALRLIAGEGAAQPANYQYIGRLQVGAVRALEAVVPLDVVWDVNADYGEAGLGHAAITGLVRPQNAPRSEYKKLRTRLTQLAIVEALVIE